MIHRIVNKKTQKDLFTFAGEVPREGEALWIKKRKYRVRDVTWKIHIDDYQIDGNAGESRAIVFVDPERHFEDELKAVGIEEQ